MADLQHMRSQMRSPGYQAAARSGGGGFGFWILAAGAAVAAFVAVMYGSRYLSGPRTLALPVSHSGVASPTPGIAAPVVQVPMPGNAAYYAGKSPDEMSDMADEVCTQHARPSRVLSASDPLAEAGRPTGQSNRAGEDFAHGGNLTDQNERLRCLLTEAPARYCSASQRSRVAANVINYFKAIEYKNVAIGLAARVAAVAPEVLRGTARPASAAIPGTLLVDPLVIDAVEGLMRAGYLQKPQREDIGANVPREVRERFARVVGIVSPCPQPPWWAVWKQ